MFAFKLLAFIFATLLFSQPIYPHIAHWTAHHHEAEHSHVHISVVEHVHEHEGEEPHALPVDDPTPAIVKQSSRVNIGDDQISPEINLLLNSRVLQPRLQNTMKAHAPPDLVVLQTALFTSLSIHGPPAA